MALARGVFVAIALLCLEALGLLEKPIVDFQGDSPSIPITRANIICSQDDYVGVHIAAGNLATDLQQVTDIERSVIQWQGPNSISSDSSNNETAIIVGSLSSSLIRHLHERGLIDVSDLEGKWETFMTAVVTAPLPVASQALVIAGSDKRGTIFGIYTLSEQSGQSPYATVAANRWGLCEIANHAVADTTSSRMSHQRSTMRSTLCPRESYKGSQASSTEDSLSTTRNRH